MSLIIFKECSWTAFPMQGLVHLGAKGLLTLWPSKQFLKRFQRKDLRSYVGIKISSDTWYFHNLACSNCDTSGCWLHRSRISAREVVVNVISSKESCFKRLQVCGFLSSTPRVWLFRYPHSHSVWLLSQIFYHPWVWEEE